MIDSFLAKTAETLVDNGYHVLPIIPGQKAPGSYSLGRWSTMRDWQRFCERQPTQIEIDGWLKWPEAGVGIACGAIVGIDIDVTDLATSQRIAELARHRFGDTPVVRIGNHPKQMLVYRAEQPFASFDVKPLQVLCTGRQFVAYGIHPDTQKPYSWPLASLTEIDISELPAITEAQARSWAAEAINLMPVGMRPTHRERPAGTNPGTIERATYEAIQQALDWISIDASTPYDQWIEIGMGIHAGIGEEGRTLWHSWSERDGGRYDAKVCDRHWNSFGNRTGNLVGPGTVYERAMIHGWKPDGVPLYESEREAMAAAPIFNLTELIANIRARNAREQGENPPEPESEPVYTVPSGEPAWLRDLDGGLRMFVDHFVGTAPSPQPWVTLGSALASFGTLAGRRYASPTDLRTNIYCIGIADSGGGKDHPLRASSKLLSAIETNGCLLGGSKIASGAGLVTAVTANPAILFPLDELGFFFQVAADRKRAPAHKTEIVDNLTEFYSLADSTFLGTEYADQKTRKKEVICQPCVSLFGVTTPASFWGALSSGNALDGSLARMIIFESENHYPDPRHDLERQPIPSQLIDIASAVRAGAEGHNSFPVGDGPNSTPNPFIVRYADAKAAQRARDIREYQTELLREHQGTSSTSVIARLAENASKVALIKAISANPARPVLRLADLEWGYDVSFRSVSTLRRAIAENIADNEHEATLKRVLKIINDAGSGGIIQSDLTRKTQFLDNRKRAAILSDLLEGGIVTALKTGTDPSRMKTTYFAA